MNFLKWLLAAVLVACSITIACWFQLNLPMIYCLIAGAVACSLTLLLPVVSAFKNAVMVVALDASKKSWLNTRKLLGLIAAIFAIVFIVAPLILIFMPNSLGETFDFEKFMESLKTIL